MAKLKPLQIEVFSEASESLRYSIPVTVGVSGIFRGHCPDDLELSLVALRGKGLISAGYERDAKAHLIVFADRLENVENAIRAAMKDFLKCEVKTERVIAYSFESRLSYYHGLDGGLYPNGSFDTKAKGIGSEGARWYGCLDMHEGTDHFSIGLYACVLDKTSYIRPSGIKVTYETADVADDSGYHARLNAFLHLNGPDVREGAFKEIPYTEAAAHFFYDTMIGLCQVSHRLESFFAKPDLIQAAIAQGAPLPLLT
jgi:hypothetical protein